MTPIRFVEGYINMCRFMKERGTYKLFHYVCFTSMNRGTVELFKTFNQFQKDWGHFFDWPFLVGEKWPLYHDHNLIKVRNEWINWMDENWINVSQERMESLALEKFPKIIGYFLP